MQILVEFNFHILSVQHFISHNHYVWHGWYMMYQMKNKKNAVYTDPKTEILVTGIKD